MIEIKFRLKIRNLYVWTLFRNDMPLRDISIVKSFLNNSKIVSHSKVKNFEFHKNTSLLFFSKVSKRKGGRMEISETMAYEVNTRTDCQLHEILFLK